VAGDAVENRAEGLHRGQPRRSHRLVEEQLHHDELVHGQAGDALHEGLGAGVYGVPGEDVPALKELLGLPDDVHFVCVVTIGRQPADADDSPLVSRLTEARKPLDELVRWERWGI